MAGRKKRVWATRNSLKSSERLSRDMLFNELQDRIDKYPISDKSKSHVVSMIHHKLVERLKQ